jgi:MurNAc alpha-1-phosphate uridylyltransferase
MTVPASAMVFAAGFGTRMGDLTRDRPKPLLPVGGSTLIDHTLDQVAEAGIARAVVNLHYRGEMIERHLAGRASPAIAFSREEPEILETGGGIVHALDLLAADVFATVNADTVFAGANPFTVLARAWDPAVADALLLLVPVEQTLGYSRPGDFFLDAPDRQPRRRGQADRAPLVYAGAQIISAAAFADAPAGAFSLNVTWNRLLARGRLRAVVYPDRWVDVGTPEGLALADGALADPAPGGAA